VSEPIDRDKVMEAAKWHEEHDTCAGCPLNDERDGGTTWCVTRMARALLAADAKAEK